MTFFPEGTKSPFARAVSAEVRARMAAQRITGRELAAAAGFNSHNYLAIRLRDEKPFTLDDVERICVYFDEDVPDFVQAAYDHHIERLWVEAEQARRRAEKADVVIVDDRGNVTITEVKRSPLVTGSFEELAEAERAVSRLDEHIRDTRPSTADRRRAMQQLEDQAARDEGDRR